MMPINLTLLFCTVLALIQQSHLPVGLCISPCKGQILQHVFLKNSFSVLFLISKYPGNIWYSEFVVRLLQPWLDGHIQRVVVNG